MAVSGIMTSMKNGKALKTDYHAYCHVCGTMAVIPPPSETANVRETVICHQCGAILRVHHLAGVLLNIIPSKAKYLQKAKELKGISIYLLEANSVLPNALSRLTKCVCSEYWDNVPFGSTIRNVRCEDVCQLTFPDRSFDLIISQDVFEHVADPMQGFREIYRVLKPGGWHVFTTPYNRLNKPSSISYVRPYKYSSG